MAKVATRGSDLNLHRETRVLELEKKYFGFTKALRSATLLHSLLEGQIPGYGSEH